MLHRKLLVFSQRLEQCCARYSVDNGWYRATINAISGQKINVKFTDFGNDEIVARNEIQQINEDYLQLPVQAVKLELFGGAGLQLRDMTERFRKLCLDKKLEATVREQLETYLLVDLNDLSVTPPLSIITELQKGGKVINSLLLVLTSTTGILCFAVELTFHHFIPERRQDVTKYSVDINDCLSTD